LTNAVDSQVKTGSEVFCYLCWCFHAEKYVYELL